MAGGRRSSLCGVVVTALVAAILLPAFLSAGPIGQKTKAGESLQERAAAAANHRRLIRNRRNISWYKNHSDFWAWYKYFTDNGNQEAVQELDRIYLAYLQNKNRAEGRRSYKAYLRHLGDIYKSCSDSDDPNCVAAYTSRSKPKPEPPKPAPLKTCDPTKDPHCLYMALVQGKSPYMPLVLPVATSGPAPAKAPAPLYVRAAAPSKNPESGYYYYAPSAVPFLSKEQKVELLRICAAEDVECLQYHLRAAYGYTPGAGVLPSYAHLGCDPKKDSSCKAKLVQKASSGLYLQYPNCDTVRDPYCAYAASLGAHRAPNPPAPAGPGSCNPLYEDGCNPLTATKFATPPESYKNKELAIRAAPSSPAEQYDTYAMFRDAYSNGNRITDPYAMFHQPSAPVAPQAADPYAMLKRLMSQAQHSDPYAPQMEAAPSSDPNDPFSAMREAAAAMHRRGPHAPRQQYPFASPNYEEHPSEERHPLGPPGKTKEGYDCFIGYDRECFPVKPSQPRFGVPPRATHPAQSYEPRVSAESQSRYIEPANPHCDPEYDSDCRMRRYEPEQAHNEPEPERHEEEQRQAAPETEQHHPEQHHPEQHYPEQHYPEQHYPEQHYPEQHYPEQRYPEERYPEQHYPEQQEQDPYETEPYQSGQEEPHMPYPSMSQNVPTLQDILRRYGDQLPEQEAHRAYADDYHKK